MIAYTLNRNDRPDRWKIYQKAMLDVGFECHEILRQPAKLVEDYENRQHLCDEAAKEFPEFYKFHRDKWWPPYGHLVCTWGWLKMLEHVASMETLDYAVLTCDDYALKRPLAALKWILDVLGDVQILQLSYQKCDWIFDQVQSTFNVSLPRRVIRFERVGIYPVWRGTGMGAADNYVVSPKGAQLILDHMMDCSYVNSEHALYLLDHLRAPKGTYSMVENNMNEDGLTEMKKNAWIQSLNSQTSGNFSDLNEYYTVSATDIKNKPKLQEKEGFR